MASLTFQQNFKLGILGGGQLGRMLIQSGIDFNIPFTVLDPDENAPCAGITEFHHGKLTDYDTVMNFGKDCDIITIEIENVNTPALKALVKQGKKVFPQPEVIEIIQDKRIQKQFYKDQNIPTADFILTDTAAAVQAHANFLPAVNKLGKEGYDGRGVQILRTAADLAKAFEAPSLLEKLIDFEKEISVIVARNEKGEIKTFPVVEMVFHPVHNLVEYLFAPAEISPDVAEEADRIARQIIASLNMVGLLAVEMFVTKDGKVLVNEIAPRPHNSGHQTIEANGTSQYEQHLRAILNLPLGDTAMIIPGAMVNLLGEDGFAGAARYEGFEEVIAISGVHVHLYGKKFTKPFRKMGHVTIVDRDINSLKEKVALVKKTLKVIS
ncbi:5-(carboxyamino)imidazole ribonucleotide synthase [Pseudochryseolinea flava]|uniref:N5-carboxyaminoimidazole ribonucleotide synthase n=1 Tax=Pseudochryseolinea flava TaxID=2059302 RepID=A0A364Y843_9BACT|nr:5-(carboxyamino)imidazole ribonucleotide synthase [Pseudochryseolinea flava]RAW03073.1 5-(carboxyamino)imidazole ribonucleotide synthase [Pseudochryseolinea flava]